MFDAQLLEELVDVAGYELDPLKAHVARMVEVQYCKHMNVYTKVHIEE